mmetsp:Transcript_19802/g.33306  ORF Transcript_19802/g.33306 Transcript_19802/m.33306 type:complete len:112 (-) Transcript_19802:1015-1350(-)
MLRLTHIDSSRDSMGFEWPTEEATSPTKQYSSSSSSSSSITQYISKFSPTKVRAILFHLFSFRNSSITIYNSTIEVQKVEIVIIKQANLEQGQELCGGQYLISSPGPCNVN